MASCQLYIHIFNSPPASNCFKANSICSKQEAATEHESMRAVLKRMAAEQEHRYEKQQRLLKRRIN